MVSLIPDEPAAAPRFEVPKQAEAIAQAIRSSDAAKLTIGLYGPWGSGKSTLLRAIRDNLAGSGGHKTMVVLFEAWRHEGSPNISIPLLHQVLREAEAHQSKPRQLAQALRRAVDRLEEIELLGLRVKQSSADADATRQWMRRDSFTMALEELRGLSERLRKHSAVQRIVVLIDDLDRCAPASAVTLIEMIKVAFDIDGLVFVLALDYQRIVRAMQQKYPDVDDAADFLHKIVQVQYHLPPLDLDRPSGYLELLPAAFQELAKSFGKEFLDLTQEIATQALGGNPRQIIRFANSFLLNRQIHGDHLDPRVLAIHASIEVAFPERIVGGRVQLPPSDDAAQEQKAVSPWSMYASLVHERMSSDIWLDLNRLGSSTSTTVEVIQHETGTQVVSGLLSGSVQIDLSWSLTRDAPGDFALQCSAFLLDRDDKVLSARGMVFYNNRSSSDGSVSHLDTERGQAHQIALDDVDPEITKVVLAVSTYTAHRDMSRPLSLAEKLELRVTRPGEAGAPAQLLHQQTFSGGHEYTGLEIAALTRARDRWRFESRNTGYAGGLVEIAARYGINLKRIRD